MSLEHGTKTFLLAVMALVSCSASFVLADDIKAWPFFYENTDPETHTDRTEILWPFFVRETTPDYAATQFLSCPQTFPQNYPHQFYFLWPLSGVRTGAGHDTWLFPFLWSGSEPGINDHYLALFPAFYYGEDGDSTTLNIALLQHNHWDKNGASHYLFPVFWNSWESTGTHDERSFGLLPLYWMNRTRSSGPTYQSSSRSGGVMLLNWWTRSNTTNSTDACVGVSEGTTDNLFPVFSRSHSSSTSESPKIGQCSVDSLWVIPYGQSHSTWSNRNETVEKSRHRLFPVYWDWSDTRNRKVDTGRALLPLWWHSAIIEDNAVTESADFLIPIGAHFYKKGEYDTRNILGPLFNRTENSLTETVRYDAFFPFFSRTRGPTESGGHIFPLAGWNTQRGLHENFWYAFPLGWNCESQETFDYRMSRPQAFALHEMETRPVEAETDCRAGPRRTVAFYPFYWSKRQADEQHQGVLPLYWRDSHRYGRTLSLETVFPLLLGDHNTVYRDDVPVYSHQNYLLSMIAHGRGDDSKQWRVFPLFSYNRCGGSLDYSSFILPFSYESWRDPGQPELAYSSGLSVPFSFLPLYRTESRQSEGAGSEQKSWFFPLYQREKNTGPAGESSKLSILWPLWNGEWMNDETRIRGLGGVMNYYERDAGGFVEQRLLYRVFTRRTRSWFNEHEVMPFYAQSAREDGTSSWGFLGGLIGGGCDGSRNYLRLLYMKIPTRAVQPMSSEAHAVAQKRHAELALNYLRHDRHDRAAVEFTLAGKAYDDDATFQSSAGEAYLKAQPDALGKELRSSIPSSLNPIYGVSGIGNTCAIQQNLLTLAVDRFENALRLGADKPSTLCKLAEALNELGRRPEALKRLDESDRLKPDFSTGMKRLDTVETIWTETYHSASSNAPATQAALVSVHLVLDELKARYLRSPSLALHEGNLIQRLSNPGYGLFTGDWSYVGMADAAAFSKQTLQMLELYRQGAEWRPGSEEQAWLKTQPASLVPPATRCARLAAQILNRQMTVLISQRKFDEVDRQRATICQLLPRTCLRCVVPDTGHEQTDYDDPTHTALHNFYTMTITVTNRPLDYITVVEALAPTLCRHRQAVVSNALESVRLEQQYIKTWHIAGEIDGKPVTRKYAGMFFERYVDLDALLGKPDHCTVTAECVVTSSDERRAVLRLGFDHTLTAELNGHVVFGPKSRKIAVRDEYRVPVQLKVGENRLRLTVTDDTLAYGFFARLSSESGEFMRDITVTE